MIALGTSRVQLSPNSLIGVGGEADVYAHDDVAIKIYRGLDDSTRRARQMKLLAFPRLRTPRVLAPLELARDASGAFVGFSMPRLDGAREFGTLCRSKSAYSANQTLDVLRSLHDLLSSLHREGVVVGDLNDGNVLVKDRNAYLIDCDSMQFGQFGCPVAHERTLAPELYGKDLAAGPVFSMATDWYAFSVLAVSALFGTHPYGGTHPRLGTLLRRAEAAVSIVSHDVTYPRAARPLATFGDEWLTWLAATFDGHQRMPFPSALLETKFVRCSCGTEHSRMHCPTCATRIPEPPPKVVAGCTAKELARSRGRILAMDRTAPGRFVAAVDATLERETGQVICTLPPHFARATLVGSRVYVTSNDHFWCHRNGSIEASGSLASFQGEAVFDANEDGAFGLRDGFVCELHSGRRVGQLTDGLSWLRVGSELGLALCRTGKLTQVFVFHTKAGGLRKCVFPHLDGKLVSLDACFDQNHAVLSLALDHNGRREHHLTMLAADGSLVAHSQEPDPGFDADAGRCVAWGSVLTATDDGLALLCARSGEFEVTRRFPESQSWVSHDATLVLGPLGSVLVAKGNTLFQLSMNTNGGSHGSHIL